MLSIIMLILFLTFFFTNQKFPSFRLCALESVDMEKVTYLIASIDSAGKIKKNKIFSKGLIPNAVYKLDTVWYNELFSHNVPLKFE